MEPRVPNSTAGFVWNSQGCGGTRLTAPGHWGRPCVPSAGRSGARGLCWGLGPCHSRPVSPSHDLTTTIARHLLCARPPGTGTLLPHAGSRVPWAGVIVPFHRKGNWASEWLSPAPAHRPSESGAGEPGPQHRCVAGGQVWGRHRAWRQWVLPCVPPPSRPCPSRAACGPWGGRWRPQDDQRPAGPNRGKLK